MFWIFSNDDEIGGDENVELVPSSNRRRAENDAQDEKEEEEEEEEEEDEGLVLNLIPPTSSVGLGGRKCGRRRQ